jgi:hypothetical protein
LTLLSEYECHGAKQNLEAVRSRFLSDHMAYLRLFFLSCSTYEGHDDTPNLKDKKEKNSHEHE